MHLSPWTVALEVLNFLVLAWLLRRFLYRPVRAMVEKRQKEIDARFSEAAAKKAEAERAAEEYRGKLASAEAQTEGARERALEEAQEQAAALHDDAERRARELLERARAQVDDEREKAERELREHALDLAVAMAERLLADALPEDDSPFLARAMTAIDAVDADRKAPLKRGLAGGVELVTARPLDDASRRRFEAWLGALAGGPVSARYLVDASLLAGVELRFAHDVWRYNWRTSLARVRGELGGHDVAAA